MTITIPQVLRRAAELIERDGWIQAAFRGPEGERCATNAISDARIELTLAQGRPVVYSQESVGSRALFAVRNYLNAGALFSWNDEEGRTQEEVIDTFRAVAAILDEEPAPE